MMRVLAGLVLAALAVVARSPPLSIGLETSWPAPPLVLELLETLYDENPNSYFPFLNLITDHLTSSQSDQSTVETALDLISSHDLLDTPLSLSTFKLALGLHTAAPRIEAGYAWYENTIDESQYGVEDCGSWVEWRGKGFCTLADLKRDIERSIEEGVHASPQTAIHQPFDRTVKASSSVSHYAILYFDSESSISGELLGYLEDHAEGYPSFGYIVRYKPSKDRREDGRTGLSGWGVELALKNTDYLVVDDRASSSGSSAGHRSGSSGNQSTGGFFSEVLGDDPWSELSTPLTKEELQDIGLKAASLIMSSEDPLQALKHLSQDFPKYSASIARKVDVSPAIRSKSRDLMAFDPFTPAIYINGKAFSGSDLNAFSLIKHLREERDYILSLTKIGLTPKQAIELISDSVIGQAQTEADPAEGLVDASDRPEEGKAITWWNDIEKDSRYKSWPKSISGYLRPIYPGQLHTIRRNTWNLVFVLDLSSSASLDIIASAVTAMIQRGLPIRFGIVPMITPGDDMSLTIAKVYYYSLKTFGRAQTKEMLVAIVENTPGSILTPGVVTLQTVKRAYQDVAGASDKASLPFEEVLQSNEIDEQLEASRKYTQRTMATKEDSASGHLFVNGRHTPISPQWMNTVQQELTNQLPFLAEQIAHGADFDDISTFFYDLPSTTVRRSKYLIPGEQENKLKIYNLQKLFRLDPSTKLSREFLYNPDSARGAPMTTWIIGDLDSPETRKLIEDGLIHLQRPNTATRLGFVHIPGQTQHTSEPPFSTLIYQLISQSALHTVHPADLLRLLKEIPVTQDNFDQDGKILEESSQETFEGTPLHAFSSGGWASADTAQAANFWNLVGAAFKAELKLRPSSPYLLSNGRLIGPIKSGSFFVEDFDTFEMYELRKRTKPVIDLLKTMYDDITAFDRTTLADIISTSSSIVSSTYASSEADGIFVPTPIARNRFYERIDKESVMSFSLGGADTALLNVVAVVDPISEQAQQWSSLLETIKGLDNVAVTVYFQPTPFTSELALKRFYRHSLQYGPNFDVDGKVIPPSVAFEDLPEKPILTLGMSTPPSWIARPESSPYDLDNLVLGNIPEPVHIGFTLNQLLIQGHAREGNNAPPRGLQLQLTNGGSSQTMDTQVMANLGYFQFKATPGVYQLAIRPGRGTEVYEMASVGTTGWDSLPVNETGTNIALTSFEGVTILPRFERKPGMEMENVLMDAAVSAQQPSYAQAVFSKMKEIVGVKSSTAEVAPVKSRHADINIFTVASGLLYERFASIMILSVIKNTQSSVKFWFIENFLSPTFLEFLPKMAEEYGFQYEFVTYKWPHWLREQTEKQRIIWAYKILFLDVLFPMDLDKVIFVDADQIVRVDMKELVDLDLQGHVYGYPPMGDDRHEMEGFRFWKTGYWQQALRGRPYHISALYVVDLKRFRQLAAGDRLRGQYHALAADPNSLANLDQDLPNSMQDQIPIFTLDKDWLWCQTWCSDESLKTAKTIDLCQNPLTKEPKLKRARQIPEWDVYDREIAEFAARISGDSGALAASVDDLAGSKKVDIEEGDGTDSADAPSPGASDKDADVRGRINDEL